MRPLTLGPRADLEIDRVALRLIDEMMAVGDPGLETRGVATLQHGRAAILDHQAANSRPLRKPLGSTTVAAMAVAMIGPIGLEVRRLAVDPACGLSEGFKGGRASMSPHFTEA